MYYDKCKNSNAIFPVKKVILICCCDVLLMLYFPCNLNKGYKKSVPTYMRTLLR